MDVTLTLDDPATATSWDSATVQVRLVTDEVTGVLAMPVTALVATAEGGYAVQVVDSSLQAGYRYVAVDPGLFADGLVEISGERIEDGTEVLVPS